jgi:hypothetical protein
MTTRTDAMRGLSLASTSQPSMVFKFLTRPEAVIEARCSQSPRALCLHLFIRRQIGQNQDSPKREADLEPYLSDVSASSFKLIAAFPFQMALKRTLSDL